MYIYLYSSKCRCVAMPSNGLVSIEFLTVDLPTSDNLMVHNFVTALRGLRGRLVLGRDFFVRYTRTLIK